MSVNPGFGGQTFIPNSIAKIGGLRKMISEMGLQTLIEVDGGVSPQTIADIAAAGADVFVAGSAIFKSPDYRQAISSMRQLANR
jgi:ribulose-phosphate 3-epimerase